MFAPPERYPPFLILLPSERVLKLPPVRWMEHRLLRIVCLLLMMLGEKSPKSWKMKPLELSKFFINETSCLDERTTPHGQAPFSVPAWRRDGGSSIVLVPHFSDLYSRFALDLVEVFFQIVHTRLPLLNPAEFRSRLGLQPNQLQSGSQSHEPPLHPALVATVLAWGAKFCEHELLNADRKLRPENQSLLAKTLIDRARDLAEALKVHRVPSTEHVVISLLIEPLQSRKHFRSASRYRRVLTRSS